MLPRRTFDDFASISINLERDRGNRDGPDDRSDRRADSRWLSQRWEHSLMGVMGTLLTVIIIIFIGNPGTGGVNGVTYLPLFWQVIGVIMPPRNWLHLIRNARHPVGLALS